MNKLAIALTVCGAALCLYADIPRTLTTGGGVNPAADGTSATGCAWAVYAAGGSVVSGTIEHISGGAWYADVGAQVGSGLSATADVVLILSKETGVGTIERTGYYAVVNRILTGRDPAEFPEMTLRSIPVPAVTSAVLAHLTWDAAVEDGGDGGVTNIIGYAVYRGEDGVLFAHVGTTALNTYTDAIPNDAEYYYAIRLLYRGTPPVTSLVLSAVSSRTFKDSDGDGLPDYFKIANDLEIGSGLPEDGPEGDPDTDGMSNYEEWIAGTRANDSNSFFFVKQPAASGTGMVINWDGVAGRRYTLFRSTNLHEQDWIAIHGPVDAVADGPLNHLDPFDAGARFYRLDVERP